MARPEPASLSVIEVFAAIRKDPVVADPGQAGDLVGKEPGAVDDPPGGEGPLGRGQEEALWPEPTASTGASSITVAPFLPADSARAIGEFVGRDDARSGGSRGPSGRAGQGLERPMAAASTISRPGTPLLSPSAMSSSRRDRLLVLEGDDELSGLAVGDAELRGQSVDQAQPVDVGLRLERPGRHVEAGVDDAAVALADAFGEVGLLSRRGGASGRSGKARAGRRSRRRPPPMTATSKSRPATGGAKRLSSGIKVTRAESYQIGSRPPTRIAAESGYSALKKEVFRTGGGIGLSIQPGAAEAACAAAGVVELRGFSDRRPPEPAG